MRSLFIATATVSLALSSPSLAQEVCRRPAETVAAVQAPDQLITASVLGRSAFACGHQWSAAVIFEKALATRPTVVARFNLATAYAATERYGAAAELYQSVVEDGQFTRVRLDPKTDGGRSTIRVNAADEAQRRLAALKIRIANDESPASIADPTATPEAGTPDGGASTLTSQVQAIVASARVAPDRALFFDQLAPAPAAQP